MADVRIKMMLIGDEASGKTRLNMALNPDYDWSKVEAGSYYKTVGVDVGFYDYQVEGKSYHLEICDAGGSESYKGMRKGYYKNNQVFLICVPVDKTEEEFKESINKWLAEMGDRISDEKVSVIIIGTKKDLRENKDKKCITNEKAAWAVQGIQETKKIPLQYLECSMMDKISVNAIRIAIEATTIKREQVEKSQKDKLLKKKQDLGMSSSFSTVRFGIIVVVGGIFALLTAASLGAAILFFANPFAIPVVTAMIIGGSLAAASVLMMTAAMATLWMATRLVIHKRPSLGGGQGYSITPQQSPTTIDKPNKTSKKSEGKRHGWKEELNRQNTIKNKIEK